MCVCVCVCVCVYIYVYTYIYIGTHMQPYIFERPRLRSRGNTYTLAHTP